MIINVFLICLLSRLSSLCTQYKKVNQLCWYLDKICYILTFRANLVNNSVLQILVNSVFTVKSFMGATAIRANWNTALLLHLLYVSFMI